VNLGFLCKNPEKITPTIVNYKISKNINEKIKFYGIRENYTPK